MIRILGVISGAAISIAALTWFVGVPQFTSERTQGNAPVGMPPVVSGEVIPPAPPVEMPADAQANTEASALPTVANADPAPDTPPAATSTAQPDLTALAEAEAAEVPEFLAADAISEPNWFAFWSPFRSEIAANGFVGELQRVTGLDYRVVKVKPGVYEVAFAYSDNDEIDSNLSTISAATGLNLPGGQ